MFRLPARAVFLFVDTCHSGALPSRTDDLALELGEGVYMMASSGADELSYESPDWGHGAFTLALLHSLSKKDLGDQGAIPFVDLAASVRREIEGLMRAAHQNESAQQPCIPVAGRDLGQRIARAAP